MTADQVQHEQAAALLVYEAAHQEAINDNPDSDENLLDFEGDLLSDDDDPNDPWSPNWNAPDTFDGADAEENPDLVGIQSAESKISNCIFEVVVTAVPDQALSKPQPGKKISFGDSPAFRFALVSEVQRMAQADSRVTIMVGQARKEKKHAKAGASALFFDVSLSNQWNFDQLMAAAQKQYEERKLLKLMKYTIRFERRHVSHKGVRFQLDRITARTGESPSMVQILNCLFEAGLEPAAVWHAEEATLPGKGICPVYSGKINIFLKDQYCTDHGASSVNEKGEPTHMILCPPPSVLVRDGTGFLHHRKLVRVGTCPHCLGDHPDKAKKCPYLGRCRACLKVLKTLIHKGNKHCCGLGVPGLPRVQQTAPTVKPVEIKAGSRADKRRKRQLANISKMDDDL